MTIHWSERAREKAKELKLSDVELARRVGWSKTTVNAWMNGQREPKLEQKMALAEALDTTTHWLDTGEQTLKVNHIPKLSLDDLKAFINEKADKAQQADSGVRIIESGNENSYLIKLDNDSMIDPNNGEKLNIPEGSTVQIDVDTEPKPGKVLLIQHNGRLMLRIWKRISENEHIFMVGNPLYTSLTFNYEGDILEVFKGTAVGYSSPL
ncbi:MULTISPECIES: helix-turn-helix domain-containing protein [unclassified Endozoicomonas]|uniref:helix-turn-helix domain-containing protein n=1 Tax=unclassified Endozoicomonas TaxID=2644528 RepID=UPI003BB7E6D4